MASPTVMSIGASCLLLLAGGVCAQQTANPPAASAVTVNDLLLAQNDSAIDQARLYRQSTSPTSLGVDANGTATAKPESTVSDDDSFGAQQILKSQERVRPFTITGGATLSFTDNVALTRNGQRSDGFAIANTGIVWTPRMGAELEGNLGFNTAIFRYFDNTSLDFENITFGAGLSWGPARLRGLGFFARYDFTELLDSGSDQILMEHTLTLGAQKTVPFGRAHGITFGAVAVAGFADPSAAQRSQLGAFLSYRLRISRNLDSEALLRPAAFIYSHDGRVDYNQIISANLRYHFNAWTDVSAFCSYGFNRSNQGHFDYNALTTGAGISLILRF